jgi:hypothetical protein
MSKLRGRDRRQAEVILARPTDGNADPDGNGYRPQTNVRHSCFPRESATGQQRRLCVHWAVTTTDAPPDRDEDDNGRPDQVDRTIQTLRRVWQTEIGELDYRAPRPDRGPLAGQGPNPGLDMYLVDVGDEGFYGYCTTDPRKGGSQRLRAHAYCVLDDDFAPRQFSPGVFGLPALRVTAAHEFFHAVQFAYEYSRRDQWFKEGTAVWIEDEVFDDINAHYAYLSDSPFHQPEIPLDAFGRPDDGGGFEYGAWIFWRFLSEYFGDRGVIREVWEQAAPGPAGDKTTLGAVRDVVENHQPQRAVCVLHCGPVRLRDALSEFAVWNVSSADLAYWDYLFVPNNFRRDWHRLFPRTFGTRYEEDRGYRRQFGPTPLTTDAEFLLDSGYRDTGVRTVSVDHLSTRYVAIANLAPSQPITISVNAPGYARGPEAELVAAYVSGCPNPAAVCGLGYSFQLSPAGYASVDLPPGAVMVVLMLGNTSAGFDREPYRYHAHLPP